jgi:asparagine synthase (glutamine-hydrolysing)
MNAICGIFNKTEPLPNNALDGVMNALSAWGRDGSSTWHNDHIALGCQITHVTSESLHKTLPLDESGLVITADARLDNREELLADSKWQMADSDSPAAIRHQPYAISHTPSAIPDSEIILSSYRKWSLDCPKHLLGDFAFAIWDEAKKRLFCARDFIGARPLYYQSGNGPFVFASDVEAVLAASGVPSDLDMEFLSAHLRAFAGYPSADRTFFTAVRKLPPAHALTVDASGMKLWRYWDPREARPVRFAREQEYMDALLDLFAQSVDCRLRSAFPIGSHLSSGLDSSAIAIHAARSLRKQGRDLAMGFSWAAPIAPGEELPPEDERRLIEEMAQLEHIPMNYADLSAREFAAEMLRRRTLSFGDFPFESPVRCKAAEGGMRVLLSGWGGDEFITFNGRGFFAETFLRGRWRTCFREFKQRAVLNESKLWNDFRAKVIIPLLPDWFLARLKPDHLPWLRQGKIPTVFQAEFARRLQNAASLPVDHLRERAGVHAQQRDLLAHGHLTMRIEGWAQGGGLLGIEYRYPLLDRRLVEFALGLPPDAFMHTGWKRYLYRQSMAGILPDDVRWHKVKDSPARPQRAEFQKEAMQGQVIPLLNQALEDWQAAGRSLACLDAERMRASLLNWREPDEEKPRDPSRENPLAAVGIELLLNPALAEQIQMRIGQRDGQRILSG